MERQVQSSGLMGAAQPSSREFDEIRVFEGVAERTGNRLDRATLRGCRSLCRSVSELTRQVRRNGDGLFYLAARAWPEGADRLDLTDAWTPMS